jgi:hypothetical protein
MVKKRKKAEEELRSKKKLIKEKVLNKKRVEVCKCVEREREESTHMNAF